MFLFACAVIALIIPVCVMSQTVSAGSMSNADVHPTQYVNIDMSIYTEDELHLLNSILAKIEENKTSWKQTETLCFSQDISLSSYHKVASYFYIYYGESDAVQNVFRVFGSQNPITKKEYYYIVLDYVKIRQYEQNMQLVHKKVDEILLSLEPSEEPAMLRQISEYLCENIEYVDECYTVGEAILEGRAACNGYALAFNILANRAGIQSDICIARMPDGIYHAWNKVTLSDGQAYFYDVTYFDASNSEKYLHSPIPLHTNDYRLNGYVVNWFTDNT